MAKDKLHAHWTSAGAALTLAMSSAQVQEITRDVSPPSRDPGQGRGLN